VIAALEILRATAREHLCEVVDRLQAPAPNVARLLDDAAEKLLA
jgi:hypothetical protein